MRTLERTVMLLACLPLAAAADSALRLSEPVAVTATYEIFGAPLDTAAPTLTLTQVIERLGSQPDREFMIATQVAQVCQKKGCFFIAEDGDTIARVTFKDYGFFIPTDASGKTVLLSGVVKPSAVSGKQAEHYAADLGATSPGAIEDIEYHIVASAVAVPKP